MPAGAFDEASTRASCVVATHDCTLHGGLAVLEMDDIAGPIPTEEGQREVAYMLARRECVHEVGTVPVGKTHPAAMCVPIGERLKRRSAEIADSPWIPGYRDSG